MQPTTGQTQKVPRTQELVDAILARKKAQRGLVDFCRFIDDSYEPYPVHRLIARKLEAVEAGLLRRLAIFVPPAVGKSRLASELFPAWFLGRNPTAEFIETSYNYDLAAGFGRNVRNLVKEPRFQAVFPGVSVADDSRAMDEWKTSAGGEYKAEGVGGGLIGFHAHIAVIDDPFKDWESANSPTNRDTVWNWYTAVLLNRLRSFRDGPGAVILIMQRWHDDDLGGRVLRMVENAEESWDIVSLPSLAEASDPLGRSIGTPLLPDGPNRRTAEELQAIQARNPRLFMALHQQKPIADEGNIFKRGWLRLHGPEEAPEKLTHYLSSDFAYTKDGGDYTVLVLFGIDSEGHIWLREVFRDQCDVLAGVQQAVKMMLDYKPVKMLLERVAMSKVVGPLLNKQKREQGAWTVLEDVSVVGQGRKESPDRAGSIAGAMQMGYMHAPRGASWLGPLEYELTRFPSGQHDDQIDALALIGMRLNSLTGAAPNTPEPTSGQIEPVGFTFDYIRESNTRTRQGRGRRRPGGLVLPMPTKTVLDYA